MSQEKVIADFSGGMNASVGVDKLKDNECLLAENVRFDEEGNVLITGANSLQNSTPLSDGTSGNVHSLFFDPSIGAIAGAGTAVYAGPRFNALSSSTAVSNPQSSKMSFGMAPNRIYMDIGSTGYCKDINLGSKLITVDWAPPQSSVAIVSGPKLAGTGTTSGSSTDLALWNNPNNITSTNSATAASVVFSDANAYSNVLLGTNFGFTVSTSSAVQGIAVTLNARDGGLKNGGGISVTLLRNGAPIGTTKTITVTSSSFRAFTLGGTTDLWGVSNWLGADINNASFGLGISAGGIVNPSGSIAIYNVQITVYQAPTGTIAAAGAAGTLTGTYSWKVAFTALNGEESQASLPTNTVTLSGSAGTLTAIPTGDLRTAGRNIYRKGGLLSSYYLVGQIADNSTTTFSDNVTDITALTQGTILAGDVVGDEPNTRLGNVQVKYPTYHYDRVFWAVGNTLIWSKPLNGFAYPADFTIAVGDNKGVTGIFSMGGELFILKPDSIWRVSGTDENSFALSKTLSPVGTDWPFTAVLSGGVASGFYFTGRILFANTRGLWAFNGYTSSKATPKLDLWFRQTDRTGISLFGNTGFHIPEILNSTVTMLNCATANPLFYYLAYAEAGQSAPNAMIVFDLERGNITKRPFAAQSLTVEPVQGYIYGGDGSGHIDRLDDWGAADNGLGGNVNLDFQDKYRDLGLRGSKFSLEGLEFMLATNGQSVTPTVYFDEGTASESLAAISTSSHVPEKVFRAVTSARSRFCRNFSFRLNYQGAAVNNNNIPNIELVHVKAFFDPRGARARTGENP